ncbi:MAG: hypothetical protein B6D56_04270 [Candidatus Omnitrophica bacterium 4484_70.1]|nr:MAG: hypothetical protein B6D56_04270 [Candidatus Omnitrophica bacterium 4484_70.1]
MRKKDSPKKVKKTISSSNKKTTSSKTKKTSSTTRRKKKSVIQRIKRSVRILRRRRRVSEKKTKAAKPSVKVSLKETSFTEKEKAELSKFNPVQILLEEKPPQKEEAVTKEYHLPPRYNDNRIVLLARDPWWLHTYWDISSQKVEQVKALIPPEERRELRWTLRVYNLEENNFFDLDIIPEAGNWYINVGSPEKTWYVEIGLKTYKGRFFALASSNQVKTPYFGISSLQDEEWVLPEEEYYKILGVYDLGRSSLERRKRLEEALKYGISSGAFSGGISSLFSIRERGVKRKFFLEVATELILYGRTEPDAELKVGGKKIKLNSDGTFSLRYMLPDGEFEFPVEAESKDRKDRIKITPVVSRSTK